MHEQLDKFSAEIEKQKADLKEIYSQKDEVREEYYKTKFEYEVENDEIKHFEHIVRVKETLGLRDQQRQERLAARTQALADRPNPFQKELETCERLIGYCELIKKKLGLGGQTDETIKEETKQIINQLAKEDVNKKVKDGKLEAVKSKKEREDEAII